IVIDVLGQPVLYGDDQRRQAAFRPSLRQALRVGMDRRFGLPVQQTGGRPPQEQGERRGARHQQHGIDQAEAETRGPKESSVDHRCTIRPGYYGCSARNMYPALRTVWIRPVGNGLSTFCRSRETWTSITLVCGSK